MEIYGSMETLIAPNTLSINFVPTIPDSHYEIPASPDHTKYISEIDQMPDRDSPLAFGLHPNADFDFQTEGIPRNDQHFD